MAPYHHTTSSKYDPSRTYLSIQNEIALCGYTPVKYAIDSDRCRWESFFILDS